MKESNRFGPDRSGVFLAPRNFASLREAAQRAGAAWHEVRMAGVRDKDGFLAAAARDLNFPPHFGANWDAFVDCFGDAALAGEGQVVSFTGAETLARHAPDEWATALEILRITAADARARKRALIVLADHAAPGAPLERFIF